MADDTNLHLNPSKPTEFEFEVQISSNHDTFATSDMSMVRFVVMNTELGCDMTFRCERAAEEHKWKVNLPELASDLKKPTYNFRVEVVVDGYYFEPATGQLILVTDPIVDVKSSSKPKVAASFGKKEEPEKEEGGNRLITADELRDAARKGKEEKDVKEAMGGTSFAGDYSAPTNSLMGPEYKPEDIPAKKQQKTPEDDMVDVKRLASNVVPGAGEAYAQDDGKLPDEEPEEDEESSKKVVKKEKKEKKEEVKESFSAQQVAERIIESTLGGKKFFEKNKENTKGGFLFKRNAQGKVSISGLESPEEKAKIQERSEKVRKALRGESI